MISLSKTKGIAAGFLFAVSDASAQSFTWASSGAQAVPVSTAGLMAMAALFSLIGGWMLWKSKRHMAGMFAVAAIAAGVSGAFVTELKAAMVEGYSFTITTPSGTHHMQDDEAGLWTITNNSGVRVTITAIDMPAGAKVDPESTCSVGTGLENGDSCILDWRWEI